MIRGRLPVIAVFSFLFPAAVLADITGIPTIYPGQTLSLDTGAVSGSGGDILLNGGEVDFQGSATGFSLGLFGFTGAAGFDYVEELGQSFVSGLSSIFTNTPLTAGLFGGLSQGNVFAVSTNGGNYAIVFVQALGAGSVTFQFLTFGAATPPGPYITSVQNNYALIPPGFTNSGIAPGSLFIIQGSGLAGATTASLQSSAGGLPTTLNGATVSVTVGITPFQPAFYYATATQLALVMPSNIPMAPAVVTVTYNGQTSPPFTIQVSQSAMGFAAYYGNGGGLGIATDPVSGNLYNFNNAIAPGANIVLWGSGLGADPVRDTTYVPGAFAINGLAALYIGGIPATIQYQGASGYPGVNQVNVQVPTNVPTGCFVPVIGVTTSGIATNEVVLPIGNGTCEDPLLTGSTPGPAQLSQQQNVNVGALLLNYSTQPDPTTGDPTLTTSATATFQTLPGSEFGDNESTVSVGGCIVNEFPSTFSDNAPTNGVNAGAITLTGSSGLKPVSLLRDATTVPGFYAATLPSGFLTSAGGTFTFTGTQGTQVGAFSAQLVFPGSLLNWTNQSAASTVTLAAGLPITWTGGAPGTVVTINGYSYAPSAVANFVCASPAEAGQFTVPPYVLASLPAGAGAVVVANQTVPQPFTATGLDVGSAVGVVSFLAYVTYQ